MSEGSASPLRAQQPAPVAGALPTREIGRYDAGRPGPLFVVIGGLHGNEPAGIEAAERVLAALEARRPAFAGRLVALRGNRAAIARGQRFVERDLNRSWAAADLGALLVRAPEDDSPDQAELRGLLNDLSALFLERCGGRTARRVVLLDLHTTSGPSTPFVCMADTLQNREVAFSLRVPVILGLEEAIEGTLLDFMSGLGHVAVAFEGGQHTDPQTVTCHEAAIRAALVAAGCLEDGDLGGLAPWVAHLEAAAQGAPPVVEVLHRQATVPGDGFVMEAGWASFRSVERGQVVARDHAGPVAAALRGRMLLPRYQEQGADGFFIGRDVRPVWLSLSAALRRLRAHRLLPLLPGVGRVETDPRGLRIDRRRARFLVRQVLHLFGYRRFREDADDLVFIRRLDGPERPGQAT